MRPGTFERVYSAIKAQLRGGRYRPGNRLEPALLAETLNASVTPVRDALHRLTGERLVEAPRHDGFRMPLLTEPTLRHLYAWHRDLLLLAILNRRRAGREPEGETDSGDKGEEQKLSMLFLALARATGNPEHALALEAITERLAPVQRLESLLLDAVEEETGEIIEALRSADRRKLRKALLRYHRRRERIVPELIERLYAGEPGEPGQPD
jgi:DNA-binding GntR family transcriptional regulator